MQVPGNLAGAVRAVTPTQGCGVELQGPGRLVEALGCLKTGFVAAEGDAVETGITQLAQGCPAGTAGSDADREPGKVVAGELQVLFQGGKQLLQLLQVEQANFAVYM